MNREQWLTNAANRLEALFVENGFRLPNYVIASGESDHSRARLVYQLIIANNIGDPMQAMAVLAHEMGHAAVGLEHGHGAAFERCVKAIGLEGDMATTTGGDAFNRRAESWLELIGPIPKI